MNNNDTPLTTQLFLAQDYIAELRAKLDTALSWQHECVDREEKLIVELEQAYKRIAEFEHRWKMEQAYSENIRNQFAIERRALELACKQGRFNVVDNLMGNYDIADYFRNKARE